MSSAIETLTKAAYNDIFFNRKEYLPNLTLTKSVIGSIKVKDRASQLARRAGTRYLQKVTCRVNNEHESFLFTFIEQNPLKNSIYGRRACNGIKILWVILKNLSTKKEKWLGRMENGIWHPK